MMHTFSEAVVTVGGSTELLLVVKATVALALGLIAMWFARKGRASVRHLLMTATFGVLLVLPIASVLVPAVRFKIPTGPVDQTVGTPAQVEDKTVQTSDQTPRTNVAPTIANSSLWVKSRQLLLWAAWVLGAAIFLAPCATVFWRMRSARRSGIPWLEGQTTLRALASEVRLHRTIEVLLHDRIMVPVTCGFLSPALLLPSDAREWSNADVRRAFMHELEHIRRGDWMVHIMARVICALYWFHPLVWVAWRKLSLEAERSCDDAVLLSAERTDYAEQLVSMARRLSGSLTPPVLSMANRSDLSTRVSAILDSKQRRGRAGMLCATASLAIAAVVVLAVAPIRAVSSVSNGDTSPSQKRSKPTVTSALSKALLEAAESGDVDEMTRLLDAGADVNATFEGDGSPLIVAAREGHKAAVQLLLDRGADPNLGVPGDGNAIIMAAREGHEDIVKLLLDRGASIDQNVPGDENALIQASAEGQLNVVKLLISRGADVNARVWVRRYGKEPDGEWRTPLNMARKGGHKAVVDFLVSTGARE